MKKTLCYIFLLARIWYFVSACLLLPASCHSLTIDTSNTKAFTTIRIGALVAFNTTIGTQAKQAIELAVEDVNKDSSILNGSRLVLQMFDTRCSAFVGAAAATELMKQEVAAIAGPQSSTVSHFIAHMGGATQVPLVSFGATDPALSEYQYPFFFRLAHSDTVQMAAVADVIGHFGWREVVAVYSDDDYGTNGISALDDALEHIGSRIVQKAALVPGIDRTGIGSILTQLAMLTTRIFVVHMQRDIGFQLLSEAHYLGLISSGFVWIVTDLIAAALDTTHLDLGLVTSTQGIIGTRSFIPQSPELQKFSTKWNTSQGQEVDPSHFNIYTLHAYDSIWLIARALDSYLKMGQSFNFEDPPVFPRNTGGQSQLTQLKIFKGGTVLRQEILQTVFNGTAGIVQLNKKGDLMGPAFEIVNMVGESLSVVGYWTNETGLSVSPPGGVESKSQLSHSNPPVAKLLDIFWPGGSTELPRGWVLPKNGSPLKIGVPIKAGYEELVGTTVDSNNVTIFHGFCIDVFEAALKYLPYYVPYKYVPYGNGSSTPSYDDLIDHIVDKVFDAVVGDTTITMQRLEKVDFTQPYIESGLVVVVPTGRKLQQNKWSFLRPFTPQLWMVIGAFSIFTGIVVWMLEHKMNTDFRGHPKNQIVTLLWFAFATLFFSQSEDTRTTLGRFALFIWLFVVLIITSSYTASLTSILTVQQLTPTIKNIDFLLASDVPIGYQTGSFVEKYLIGLGVDPERLKPLPSMAMYAKALSLGPDQGGVAAIVDELPYVQLFQGVACNFTIVGEEFTKSGWGFAFPRNSPLNVDLSTAILSISESGELQRIHDLWFSKQECDSASNEVQSSTLGLGDFRELFCITGIASGGCLVLYTLRLLWNFRTSQAATNQDNPAARQSSIKRCVSFVKSFAAYVDEEVSEIEERMKRKRKRKKRKEGGDDMPPLQL